MKFITTRNPKTGKLELFTFPESVDHDCMAEILNRIKNYTTGDWIRVNREPISAGFVSANMVCYGHSHTLDLSARDIEDTELLKYQLGG